MKTLIQIGTLLFVIGIGFTSCKEVETEIINESCTDYHDTEATFIHSVFFWAKEGITDIEKAKLLAGLDKLATVRSISRVYYGPPASTEARDVVDNTYTYAFIVHFADQAAHDAYQIDPIHLAFIEENKDYWGQVKVYDNVIKSRN